MFTWDDSTSKTLSALPTNQLRISLEVRAAILCETKILAQSSRWTRPNTGIHAVRGKRLDASFVEGSHEALSRP